MFILVSVVRSKEGQIEKEFLNITDISSFRNFKSTDANIEAKSCIRFKSGANPIYVIEPPEKIHEKITNAVANFRRLGQEDKK